MQSQNKKSKTASATTQKVDTQPTTQTQTSVVSVENANKIVENKLQGQVVEVKKGGSRVKTASQVAPVAPVAQVAPVAEVSQVVVPATQTAQTVTSTTTKGKKTGKTVQTTQSAPVVEVAPVVAPVVAPAVVAVSETVQVAGKKGKKTTKTAQVVEPVVAVAPVVAEAVVAEAVVAEQVAGAKTKKAKTVKVAKAEKTEKPEKVKKVKAVKAVKAVKVAKVQVEQGVQENDDKEQDSKLRYFKLYYNNENKGRYCGKKPKQAANKAFSSIVKELNNNGENGAVNVDINYSIKECTRHSKHKEYKYIGKRETLDKPVPVYIPHEEKKSKNSEEKLSADELRNKILSNASEEKSVSNVPIKQKKVETLHSGKEVTTNGGSVYLLSDSGKVFKKIIYHFHNKIQKAPKPVQEVALQA
jgi:hypothetical protein